MSKKNYIQKEPPVAIHIIMAIIAALGVAFVPALVKLAIVEHQAEQIEFRKPFGTGVEYYDLFSYNKAIVLIILGIFALITLAAYFLINSDYYKGGEQKEPWYKNIYLLCSVGTSVFILLSAFGSKYQYTAFNGAVERYESAFVLLAYIILFYMSSKCIRDARMLKIVVYSLIASSIFIGLIGFSQFIQKNVYDMAFFQKLICGDNKVSVNFTTVYGTFFNPNYMGVYSSMLVPLTFVIAMFSPFKSVIKYVSTAACLLMIINLIGSTSRTAFISLAVTALVCVVIYFISMFRAKQIKAVIRNFIIFAVIITSATVAILAGIGQTRRDQLITRASTILQQSEEVQRSPVIDLKYSDNKELIVVTKTGQFSIGTTTIFNNLTYIVKDSSSVACASTGETRSEDGMTVTNTYTVPDVGNISITNAQNDNVVYVNVLGSQLFVGLHSERGALLLNVWGKPIVPLEEAPYFLPFGNESMGSSRGYIWSRSFPLLKNTILLGYGADCYAYEFPQDDVVNKLQHFGSIGSILDKPHQMFLQWGINNGVISLLLIFVIFGLYLYQSIKLIIKSGSFKNIWQIYSFAILSAVIGFLVSAMANDSSTSFASVFWILLGIGVGVNSKLKKSLVS